ncbi:hypothetical protein M422DRAFT_259979 [Sphaerobolus stellatus SS14]|uniref:Uncharacterized protein n=1 Tax=Sphaerobolus stellatus (strain SS14) TaxID=990650 RepID=A0A0C9VJN0_SPHS4|nr:hypothetical protein M422DRAFT_259979 [Sphaerobolus stellatus SS14]
MTPRALLAAVVALSLGIASSARPTLNKRAFELSLCTDANFEGDCITLTRVDVLGCIDFSNGLTPWDKALSSAVLGDGLVCQFFAFHDCQTFTDPDSIVLTTGEYPELVSLDFNDLPSSVECSAV